MAVKVFLRFSNPTITGDAIDPAHEDDIQVLSWSHDFKQTSYTDFIFTKHLDRATDDLLKLCWNAKVIGSAELFCYRTDTDNRDVLYLAVAMDDVLISNFSVGEGGDRDLPVETISLAYARFTYRYSSNGAQHPADPAPAR